MQMLDELFGGGSKQWEPDYCWQDREIRFDVHPRELKCRPSEDIIETMDPVEDTKVTGLAWAAVMLHGCIRPSGTLAWPTDRKPCAHKGGIIVGTMGIGERAFDIYCFRVSDL